MHGVPPMSSTGVTGLAADVDAARRVRQQHTDSRPVLERLGLPQPQIATKLYGAIALTLAVVYVLAAVTIQFATQTGDVIARFREQTVGIVMLATRLETLIEQNRSLIASVTAAPDPADERTYGTHNEEIAALMARLGYGPSHSLSEQFTTLVHDGAQVFDLARRQMPEQATAASGRYVASAEALKREVLAERQRQAHQAEADLDQLASNSRSLITRVCAAAAIAGLLIGPIGLFFLHRVLARLQGIRSALLRLARNDTSVDIPGLTDQDEVGQLARSVAVFKARSIELLQKKGEFERLNLQLDAAINNMPLGLSMFDAQERLLVCNKRYAEMYDLPGDLTRPGTVHCAVWDYATRKGARHFQGDGPGSVPGTNQPASMIVELGCNRIVSISRQPLKGGGWVALHEDITLRRRQEQEITHLARHDPLTNLANRALFREQLQQALTRLGNGQGFAVLCLDLDHFKSVNDTLGHPVGDALLKHVSERLARCVRHGDLVARLGGDEFAIIQANVRDPVQTETLAARIVETVSKPYEIEGQRIDISTSIGMTLAPRDSTDADELMKNADLALYRTKSDGRHGYSFFRTEMNDRIQVRRALEIDLRKALDQEEFELFYQPLVCLNTQKVTGFEALLRWQHPVRGTIAPAEFISVAEEIGLISEIGAWAMHQACAAAARWPRRVKVAINLSPLQIKRNLIELVLQALALSGLPPERLELEITESVLLQDSQNTLAMLYQLRQLGVRIAMDDFGTGYCSLSYLRSFPFDKIKIDRAFISGIEHAEESRAIVETIVSLSRSLGMSTVAEGIESTEQLEMVRACGCQEAQGYLFSPPIPSSEVHPMLEQGFTYGQDAA